MKKTLGWTHFYEKKPIKFLRIMKLLLVLMTMTSLTISAKTFSQYRVTLDVQNVGVMELFKEIQKKTNLYFVYNVEDLVQFQHLSVSAQNESLETVLKRVFGDKTLDFIYEGEVIIVKPKILQQTLEKIVVKGTVKDKQGKIMPGVSVVIKGTSLGVATDVEGRYTLTFPNDDQVVLLFTFIGMKPKEVLYTGQKEVDVTLEENLAEMDEVVVVGYGTSKKKDLTGSVVRIPQQVLEKSSFTDVGKMLQGQVAGVEILQGLGRPGDRVRIRIRGESTLQGDASPLIVIDDIPMPEDYDLNMLNPNDIQNIDVLKGASAAAIYGSKGSAGVLLISTKQGKDGSPEVFYSGNVFFKNFESPVKTLNGDQFRHLIHEAVLNNFKYSSMNNPDANFDIRTSSDYKQVVVPGYFGEANTDWMDVLTRQPVSTNHTLGIRGGNKYAAYYASLGYTEDKGRVVGNDARRISLTSNLDIKATKFLELGLHFTGTKQKIKNSLEPNGWDDGEGLSMAAAARPDIPVYDENGDYYRYYSTGHDRYLNNPLQLAQEAPKTIDRMFYTVSGYLRLLLTKDLRYQMTYSYSETKDDSDLYWGSYTYNGSGGYYNDAKGILDVTNSYSNQSNFDNALYYTKTLENHDVSVMLGTTFNQEKAGNLAQTYQDFPDDYIQNAIYSAAKLASNSGSDDKSAYFSVYGRLNYKLMDRYLLTATVRRDASSKFSPSHRAGWFPSVAGGWIMSEENFLKDNKIGLSFLKLRVGWGVTGDNRIGRYTWRTRFTNCDYFDKPGAKPMSVGNDQVKWEQTVQMDYAVDYGFWHNRIRGSLGYYTKNTKGLLYAYSMAPSAGLTNVTLNMAKIHNQGVEFDINAQVIETNDVTLGLNFNISKNKSKVLNLDREMTSSVSGGLNLGTTVLKEGEPIGLFYGYKCLGIVKDQKMSDEIFEKYGNRYQVGRYAYEIYADGPEDQRQILGKTNPDFYGGFAIDFRYKQLSFRAAGKYSVGAKKHWSGMEDQFHVNLYNPSNRLTMALNRWTPDNPEAFGQRFGSGWESSYVSDNYLFDASFLKLTDITIGYDLPFKWLQKIRVSNCNIYGAVNNVFTLTKYPGTNVESYSSDSISGAAQDYSVYPLERSFTIGLKIMFR